MGRDMRILSMWLIGAMMVAVSACHRAPVSDSPVAKPAASKYGVADRQARVPNEYLITLVPEAQESAIADLFGRYGIKESHALGGETYLLVLAKDPGPGELSELIRDDARFQAVQPNLIYWANRSGKSTK
ncbi:MAG: hypothetical protein A2100_04305 [Sideroxydans sp. GWF2_59_14]|nr:MAG: hypothetical protein A2100_04305 [Sideroxydans sp. GWF2_59_14]HAF43957.1 hypothetical protein [Gallionellaceae bacterium]